MNQILFLKCGKISDIRRYGNTGSGAGEDDQGAVGLSASTVRGERELKAELILRAPDWYGGQQVVS